MTLAALKQVSKEYKAPGGDVVALAGVDLTICKGEALAITGPSGSGKSTLLHLLGLLDHPTKGTHHFDGKDVALLPDDALSKIRREKIGFVFQAFHLIPQLTVLENVTLPLSYRSPRGCALQKAEHALERVGLADRMHHRPEELSGGQKQRAATARAVVGDPLMLLADEPTGNLDSDTGKEILDLFESLSASGMALVLVTHAKEVAARFQRRLDVRDGSVLNA